MDERGRRSEEFDAEPVRGLPEAPPAGERILWQGSPDWRSLARRCFRTRWAAGVFLTLGGWQALRMWAEGAPGAEIVAVAAWFAGLAAIAVAVLSGFAWLTARAAVYNVTDRRVAMRIGTALTVTLNLPYRWVDGADLRLHADGTGDVPLTLGGSGGLGYLVLWPHCRPWRMARPQPMLRCVPDAGPVATILADAMRADLARREAQDERQGGAKISAGAASGVSPVADRPRAARGEGPCPAAGETVQEPGAAVPAE
ncbi:MAG: photosynthetic complex putative assembly protein PuhB [Pseudomonadota bacterium]